MELKANELRINNLLYDNLGRIIKVSEIREEHIVFYLSNNSKIKHTINSFKPIPLTEEWLLKFGFEKRKQRDNFYYFGFGENPVTKDWMLCLKYFKDEDKFFFMNGFHIIKHVHQLQNLYFALTNEELTIKM